MKHEVASSNPQTVPSPWDNPFLGLTTIMLGTLAKFVQEKEMKTTTTIKYE